MVTMVFFYCRAWWSLHCEGSLGGRLRYAVGRPLGRRTGLGAAAVVLVALGLALAASANASSAQRKPVDRMTQKSEHTALRALQRYFSARVSGLALARQNEKAFVAAVGAECPDTLAAVSQMSPDDVNEGAVVAFGEELAADLLVVAEDAGAKPLADLTAMVAPLRWPSPRYTDQIRQSLDRELRLIGMAPRDPCADAQALASEPRQPASPVTLKFLADFGRARTANGLSGLVSTLARFAGPANRRQMHDISKSRRRFANGLTQLTLAELGQLLAVLGLD
jgi:hypothetical protein